MNQSLEKQSQEETEKQVNPPSPSVISTVLTAIKGAGKKKPDADNKKLWESSWELSLDGEELQQLEELGLGVGVDITVKHPWARKSAFQAKRVAVSLDAEELEAIKQVAKEKGKCEELEAAKLHLAKAKAKLIVVNESNQFLKTSEHVETYSEIQAGLESSFRPDPSKPISVNITADFHRSNTRSKTIKGSTVLTRTVAFRVQHPSSRKEGKEMFENQLHHWLMQHNCCLIKSGNHKQTNQCIYSPKTNHYCIDYLKELGGVTHYVSSVTLGATKYQISQNSTLFNSLSTSSGCSVDSFVSASTKSKVSKRVFQSSSKEQQIGKVPHHDNNIKELLKFRTKGEAVVRCSYNSLANLVSHPGLRKHLEMGIQEYIDTQKNGTRGPYYIGTAKMEVDDKKIRRRNFWRVDSNENKIITTLGRKGASNFYLKPIVRHLSGEKYFHIVTDPEDVPKDSIKVPENKNPDTEHAKDNNDSDFKDDKRVKSDSGDIEKNMSLRVPEDKIPDSKDIEECSPPIVPDDKSPNSDEEKSPPLVSRGRSSDSETGDNFDINSEEKLLPQYEPKRYVTVNKDGNLSAEFATKNNKSNTIFKLKNPMDNMAHPLSKSQWLPEASLGSQPYVICHKGQSFQWGMKAISCEQESQCVKYKENSYNDNCLFVLERGHKT